MLIDVVALFLVMAASGSSPPAPAISAAENPDRIICRRPEPVLGSRVARRRICRTVSERRAFDADRAQMRRDLNAGNCAGASSCSCNGPDC